MKSIRIPLISLLFVLSCHSLRNSPAKVKVECGVNLPAYDVLYAKIVDDQKNTLSNLTLKAAIFRAQTQSFEPLPLSEKACINLPEELPKGDSIVVTTVGEDRYSGKVVNLKEAQTSRRIELKNYARDSARIDCTQPILSSKMVNIPVNFNTNDIAQNYQFTIEAKSKTFALNPAENPSSLLSLNYRPSLMDFEDGAYQIIVRTTDLLRALKEEPESVDETKCLLLIDNKPPKLRESSLASLQRVSPSQGIEVAFDDQTEIKVFTCLAEANSSQCNQADDFQASSKAAKIIAPARGKWTLFYYSTDQLGHSSEVLHQDFTVVNQQEIDGIKREIRLNHLLSRRNPLESYRNAQKIVERFRKLSVNEEIEQVEIPLALHLIQIGFDLKETWSTLFKNLNELMHLNSAGESYTLFKGEEQILAIDSNQNICGKVPVDHNSQIFASMKSSRFYVYRHISLPGAERGFRSWIDTYAIKACKIERMDTHFMESAMTEDLGDKSILPMSVLFSGLRFDASGEKFAIFSTEGVYSFHGLTSEIKKISNVYIEEHQESLSFHGPVAYDLVYDENFVKTLVATDSERVIVRDLADMGIDSSDVFWFSYYDQTKDHAALLVIDKACSVHLISTDGAKVEARKIKLVTPDSLLTETGTCKIKPNSRPARLSKNNQILRIENKFYHAQLDSEQLTLTKLVHNEVPDFDLWFTDQMQNRIMIRSSGIFKLYERQDYRLNLKKNIQLSSGKKATFVDFGNRDDLVVTDGDEVVLSREPQFFTTYRDTAHLNTSKFIAWNPGGESFYITNDVGKLLEVNTEGQLVRQGQRRTSKGPLIDFIAAGDAWLALDSEGKTNLWKVDDLGIIQEGKELTQPPSWLSPSRDSRLNSVGSDIYYWGTPNAWHAGKLLADQFESLFHYYPYDDDLDPKFSNKSMRIQIANEDFVLSRFRSIHNEFATREDRFELLSLPDLKPSYVLGKHLNPGNVDSFTYSQSEGDLLVWSNERSELSGFNLRHNAMSKLPITNPVKSEYGILSLEVDPTGRWLVALFPDRVLAFAKEKEWQFSWELKLEEKIVKLNSPLQWLPQGAGLLFSANEDSHYHLTPDGDLLVVRADLGILRLAPKGDSLLFEKPGYFRTLNLQVPILNQKLCQIVNSEVCNSF